MCRRSEAYVPPPAVSPRRRQTSPNDRLDATASRSSASLHRCLLGTALHFQPDEALIHEQTLSPGSDTSVLGIALWHKRLCRSWNDARVLSVRCASATDAVTCRNIAATLPDYFATDDLDAIAHDATTHDCWIAELDERPSGFLIVDRRSVPVAEIVWMATAEECRGQGIEPYESTHASGASTGSCSSTRSTRYLAGAPAIPPRSTSPPSPRRADHAGDLVSLTPDPGPRRPWNQVGVLTTGPTRVPVGFAAELRGYRKQRVSVSGVAESQRLVRVSR